MADDPIDSSFQKKGSIVLQMSFIRNERGLSISVKSASEVEELLRSWSGGDAMLSGEYEREWRAPKDPSGKGLQVWNLIQDPGKLIMTGGFYTLSRPGGKLIFAERSQQIVNLSFLRLVGISSGNGVQFEIPGVYSLDFVKDIQGKINQAAKQFYSDYLLPIELSLIIQTQENRL